MKKIVAALGAGWILAVSYGCSSSSSSSDQPKLPGVSADKLGQICTGFGTSPGDTATFKDDADCKAGYCLVDLTGNEILSYCTADCDVYSCPSGYVCNPVTLGDTKHACFVDPNAPDAGVCTQPTGTYSTHFVARDTTSCPPLADNTVTYDLKDAGTGCEQSFDQASCTFTTNCTQTSPNGTVQTTDVVTVPVDNSTLTDVLTVVYSGGGQNLTCIYDVSDTKR